MEKTNFGKIKLGRLVIGVMICVLMITTSMATAMISVKTDRQTNPIVNNLSYTFLFKEPSLKSVQVGGSEYTTIEMPGCMAIGKQAGDPLTPVKIIKLLLPPKKSVASINVVGKPLEIKTSIDLTEKPVFPYQKSVPIGSDEPQEFIINKDVYSSANLYPFAIYNDYHIGYSHGYAILDMGLNPMQYNPKDGTLIYYPEMTITINLKDTGYTNQFFSNNPSDEAYVKSLVSNPDITNLYQTTDLPMFEYPGGLCDPSQHFDYVIVTTTSNGLDYWDIGGTLTYNWDSLMAKHAGDGLSSTVVTVQDILACPDYYGTNPFNDSKARIREFCKDAYEDWGTRYVLIAGDADTIPARQLYYVTEGNFDSDLYWSNLDNNFNADQDSQWGEAGDSGYDLYAEIYIGRVTCDTPQDVSNWLTKSFYYADSTDYDYLNNAGFYGGALGFPGIEGDDFIDYSAIKGTDNYLGTDPDYAGPYPTWLGFQFGFETWNQVNTGNQFNLSKKITDETPNPGWSGGGPSALMTAISNDQITLLSAVAHANPQYSCDIYYTEWEDQVHNTKPFFITDYGCHCGDFDDGDGVLESMLFHSDTELAFGCVYNTAYGWGQFYCTNSSSAVQQKSFWDYYFDMENNSGDYANWQLGKGHAWSKDMMAPTINWDPYSETWRGTIGCCLLFADPAQTIKSPSPSDPPAQPTKPVGKTLGIWHVEYSYTSSTTEPDNEQIYYLFDWDDGSNSGWLGPYYSGETVTGSHTWTELGTYNVRVKARDIWGAGSLWSEPLVVTITDNTPPEIPQITGPSQGEPGNEYLYNIVTTDPQDQNIWYFIDWGDDTTTGWLGPYVSGTQIHLTHAWTEEGTYTVKAKAKDILDMESDWATLDVVMPLEVSLLCSNQQQFLIQLLNQHIIN